MISCFLDFPQIFLMINVQEDLRNNKSIESGLWTLPFFTGYSEEQSIGLIERIREIFKKVVLLFA